jgi:transposase
MLGLVPRQNSTGGKDRLGRISKRGDGYPRRLLVSRAHAVLLRAKASRTDPWLVSLPAANPRLVVAIALANKTARVAWAIMSRNEGAIHVSFLIGFRNRLVVILDWLWSYVTFQSGARLITRPGSH